MSFYGAVELGGTKTVCAIVDESLRIYDKIIFRTSNPETTLEECRRFLSGKDIDSLGIGSFGPLDLNSGMINNTPKKGWGGTLLREQFAPLRVPISIDTDVGCACLAESHHSGNDGIVAYVTVGTGIGVGLVANGRILHGSMHPEMGHIAVKRLENDSMKGVCPFHPDCCESLSSGPALWKRSGTDPSTLTEKDGIWKIESNYLAQLAYNLVLTLSPDKIIFGGGVMKNSFLIDRIRNDVKKMDGGFVGYDTNRITLSELNGEQGILGAALIAMPRNR